MTTENPTLLITFPDETVWSVPAIVIAHMRANYFAQADEAKGDAAYIEIYDKEFKYTLSDDYELKDWVKNNCNWEDVRPYATQIFIPPRNDRYYQEHWGDTDVKVSRT